MEGQERYIIKIETEGGEQVVRVYDTISKKIVETSSIADKQARARAEADKKAAEEAMKAESKAIDKISKEREKLERANRGRIDLYDGSGADLVKDVRQGVEAVNELADADKEVLDVQKEIGSDDSIRSQLRAAKEEATKLTLQYRAMSDEEKNSAKGQELSKKIDELTEKAGALKDAMDDATRSINASASDTKTFSAISEGLDTLISTYGVAQGAAAAFGADEQELMEMQTKFQAVLTASNAIKTIQNNLQKESNIMQAVANVQTWAKARAEAAATSATIGHTAAQAAFNVVANANPYLLLATALLTLIGAMALFIKKSDAAKEAQKKQAEAAKKQAEEMKKAAEEQKHISEVYGSHTADLIGKFKLLQVQFKNLRTEGEKRKWIDDNKTAFSQLGLSVKNLNDAYSVLVTNAPKVIEALRSMAEAEALKELYQEAFKKKEEVKRNKQKEVQYTRATKDNVTDEEAKTLGISKQTNTKANGYGGYNIEIAYTDEALKKVNELRIKRAREAAQAQYNEARKEVDEETNYYLDKYEQAQKKANEAQAGVSQFKTPTETPQEKENKKEMEMQKSFNEYSEEWYNDIISKLAEEKRNTPKYIDGVLNPEFEQVEKEIKYWTELFEEAFGDNTEILKSLLQEFATVEQKRDSVKGEFARKRDMMYTDSSKKIFRDGFSQENVDELNQQEEETLNAIDMNFAQRQEEFQYWMESVANITLDKLEETLKKAEEELAEAEKSGDSNASAVARAKVNMARDRVRKERAKKESVGVDKKDVKSWDDLYKVLTECAKEFDEIGELVGGLAGDMIKAAGKIATGAVQMISGIQSLAKDAIAAEKATAEGAEAAMSTAEKASVILTVISAALQVVSAIMGLLGKSSSQESYEKAQKVYEGTIDALDWAIDKQLEYVDSLAGKEAVNAYGKALQMNKSIADSTRTLAKQYLNAGASISSHSNGIYNKRNISSEAWRQAASSMGMTVDSFQAMMGQKLNGLFNLSATQLEKLKSEASLFYGSLDEETRSYWDKIIENEEKASDILQEQLTQLTTLKEGQLTDSWKSMLADMSVSSKDFADDLNDTLKEAIVNSLVDSKYGKRLEELRKKLADGMSDGTLDGVEAQALRDEYIALSNQAISDAKESLRNAGIDTLTDQSFSKEAAASVTQDTMDEVNGRLTAVQVNMQMMLSVGQMSQQNLANIERYTSYLPTISRDIALMRDDIADKL